MKKEVSYIYNIFIIFMFLFFIITTSILETHITKNNIKIVQLQTQVDSLQRTIIEIQEKEIEENNEYTIILEELSAEQEEMKETISDIDTQIYSILGYIELEEERKANHPYYSQILELTDYEKELIYRITYREAGNQPEEGKRAVMEVILNRVKNPLFPNTVEGVLSQPGQFSTWSKRHLVPAEELIFMAEILELVAAEDPILTEDYLFFNCYCSPCVQRNTIRIEGHYFGTR